MPKFAVDLIESKVITIEVRADNEEDAELIAEEQYYAEHSIDDTLEDFRIKEVTKIDEDQWAI